MSLLHDSNDVKSLNSLRRAEPMPFGQQTVPQVVIGWEARYLNNQVIHDLFVIVYIVCLATCGLRTIVSCLGSTPSAAITQACMLWAIHLSTFTSITHVEMVYHYWRFIFTARMKPCCSEYLPSSEWLNQFVDDCGCSMDEAMWYVEVSISQSLRVFHMGGWVGICWSMDL